jgi:Glutaredoxin-like domain (DUF836)
VSRDEPRVVVLVTTGCHLCADACTVVGDVCAATGVSWSARDLADVDAATRSRWREYVPVVLIDGEVHEIFRVSAERLRGALG